MSATVSKWEVVGGLIDILVRFGTVVVFVLAVLREDWAEAGIALGVLGLLTLQDIYSQMKKAVSFTTINIKGDVDADEVVRLVKRNATRL